MFYQNINTSALQKIMVFLEPKGLSKKYVVLGVGMWVKVKTLRLHYVMGEGGGYRTKTLRKTLRFFLLFYFLLSFEFLTHVRIFFLCLCLCVLLTILHFTFFFCKQTFLQPSLSSSSLSVSNFQVQGIPKEN